MKNFFALFRSLLFSLPFLLLFTNGHAQNLPGKRDTLQSTVLKEERVFHVLVPEAYKPGSNDKYDVLYVTDGDGNAKTISAIQEFTHAENYMPQTIIVALLNTNRERDMTPSATEQAAGSGGADKFLAFFKNELVPHINKNYPTSGNNILYGHSLGGLFAMYALVKEPQLFNSYLAVDPSFWWDNLYMNKLATEKLSESLHAGKSLFITGREGGDYDRMGIAGMDTILKGKQLKGLNFKTVAYPNEHHGSLRLKSVYDGLKFFYDGYSHQAVEFHPMNGIVLKDKPYKVYYFGPPETIHYSTDGSEPTASSPKLITENTLTNGAKLAVKILGRKDRYAKTSFGEFKLDKAPAASARPNNVQPGGFRYKYYEGEWDVLPDFSKLQPVQTGVTDKNFGVKKLPRQTNFGVLIEGHIEIQQDGYYIFALDSDDGSKLFVADKLLIDFDGLHGDGRPKTYMLPLQKGFYPLRLEYFQKAGGANLKLEYVLPVDKPRPMAIPFELQYSQQ